MDNDDEDDLGLDDYTAGCWMGMFVMAAIVAVMGTLLATLLALVRHC